ncbi:hypothetical protein K456DRAFT_46828 [Colletotrichum gloeosporioides 23]|nr:hypothetical protein K456DRAFT_46828 [Colletotrichum gloeosporioides 23]
MGRWDGRCGRPSKGPVLFFHVSSYLTLLLSIPPSSKGETLGSVSVPTARCSSNRRAGGRAGWSFIPHTSC